jgi:hypothetical protein
MRFNPEAEFAAKLITDLQRFFSVDQIAYHTGMSPRTIFYIKRNGVPGYPAQLALEILAQRILIRDA